MDEKQLEHKEIEEHYKQSISKLDERVRKIDVELGKGIRSLADSDDIITLATPDENSDGETKMYVHYIPHVGGKDAGAAVTDIFYTPDRAWEGDVDLYKVLDELVSDGHLIVVEDSIGMFEE